MPPNNNEIFQQFWKEYQWPSPKEIEYRLYYDEHGDPICYTTEDLPGTYIVITSAEYASSDPKVRVKNGKLIPRSLNKFRKIVPNTPDGTTCHPRDVTIVVDPELSHTKWNIRNDI